MGRKRSYSEAFENEPTAPSKTQYPSAASDAEATRLIIEYIEALEEAKRAMLRAEQAALKAPQPSLPLVTESGYVPHCDRQKQLRADTTSVLSQREQAAPRPSSSILASETTKSGQKRSVLQTVSLATRFLAGEMIGDSDSKGAQHYNR